MAGEDINIRFSADTSQASRDISTFAARTEAQIRTINTALSDNSRNWLKSSGDIKASINDWGSALKASTAILQASVKIPGANPFSAWGIAMKGTGEAFKVASDSAKMWQQSSSGSISAFNAWTQSAKSANDSTSKFAYSLSTINKDHYPRLRYALYDISSAATVVANNFGNVAKTVIKTTADYETSFTAVERTTGLAGDSALAFKKQLMDLATQIPLTFKDITGITMLGAQMGVANKDLISFTKNVAEFSTVSGIATEEVAKSFGTIGNLLGFSAQSYANFGSAVASVGNISAATETQILSMIKKISGVAAATGFSTQNVIGLSAALASLGVAPQRASGALTRIFQEINRAVADGGIQLQNFATVMNMTTTDASNLAQTDMSAFFNKFLTSINGLDSTRLTQVFDILKLNGSETVDVLSRLSNGIATVTKYQTESFSAYANGTFLAEKYATKVDDLNSKIITLKNAFDNLAVVAGSAFSGPLGGALDLLKAIAIGWSDILSTGPGQIIGTIAIGAVALIAVVSGLIALFGRFVAANLAARTALITAAESADIASASYFRLAGSLVGLDVSSVLAKASIERLNSQFFAGEIGLQAYTLGLAGVTVAEGAATVGANLFKTALVSTGIGAIVVLLGTLAAAVWGVADAEGQAATGSGQLRDAQGRTKDEVDALNKNIRAQNKQFDDLKKSAGGAATAVRTLGDYANDLSSVFKRSFELRFDKKSTLDAITSGWQTIAKASEDARISINDLNATLQGLTADKKLKEYFLRVAMAYGDTINADKIRADLAKIDADIADKERARADAQTAANKTLVGSSKAAIDNRNTIRGMVGTYSNYIQTLAASGASQEQINAAIKQSETDFYNQGVALGFSSEELKTYGAQFQSITTIVNALPKDVTIKTNMDPAIQALNEFIAKAKAAGTAAGSGFANNFNAKTAEIVFTPVIHNVTAQNWKNLKEDIMSGGTGQLNLGKGWENIWSNFIKLFQYQAVHGGGLGGYADGGYTGAGGKYQPAGIVHKGEYVVPASQVNQSTGLPYYMQQPRSFASGGYVGASGPMMVTLAPEDRALLRSVGGSGDVVLYANNEALARSVNAGNRSIVAAGGRP